MAMNHSTKGGMNKMIRHKDDVEKFFIKAFLYVLLLIPIVYVSIYFNNAILLIILVYAWLILFEILGYFDII